MPSTNPTQLIVLRTPGDLIAHLPYQIGYHPSPHDVVFVGLRGTRPQGSAVVDTHPGNQIDPTHQTDLDPQTLWRDVVTQILDPTIGAARATAVAGHTIDLPSLGEPRVVVVSYGAPDADALARGVMTLNAPELVDVLRVHQGRWWSLTCEGETCCPPEGRRLSTATESTTRAVVEGISPRPTRAKVTAVLQPGPVHLVQAVTAHLPAPPADAGRRPMPRSWRDGLSAMRAARDLRLPHGDSDQSLQYAVNDESGFGPAAARLGTPEAVAAAARLLVAMEDYRVRDQCLSWSDEASGQLWRDLIRYAPPGWSAPVATAIGVHALCNHDRTLARTAFRHALEERPGYDLARLLSDLLLIGLDVEEITAALNKAATAIDC